MNEGDIIKAMEDYKFYHIIQLTENIKTPGNPAYVPTQNLCMKHLKSLDLKGKRVLDIGCRDGLFSFAAESMGAGEVVSVDNDISKPATEFLIPFFESKINMMQLNVYDLNPEKLGKFDVVIFPGVLYHLRYPFWGIKAIRDVLNDGGHLIVETPIWFGQRNNAMLYCPIGDESPYEPTSCTFFNEKGMADTLKSLGFEILEVEFLKQSFPRKTINYMKKVFQGRQDVNRCVFKCKFNGYDEDNFLTQYWDSVHNFHTDHGG